MCNIADGRLSRGKTRDVGGEWGTRSRVRSQETGTAGRYRVFLKAELEGGSGSGEFFYVALLMNWRALMIDLALFEAHRL